MGRFTLAAVRPQIRTVALGVLLGGAWATCNVKAQDLPAESAAKSAPAALQDATVATVPVIATKATQATPVVAAQPATAPVATPKESASRSLTQQIAALPKLDNAGIDVTQRGKAILSHLNAVLRYYRGELTSAQKVGEPSDVLYSQQASMQATQAAQYAFQSSKNLAALLLKLSATGAAAPATVPAATATPSATTAPATAAAPATNTSVPRDDDDASPAQTEAQRMATARANVQAKLNDLLAQDAALDKQVLTAKAKDLPALRQLDEQVEGQVELQKAIVDALGKLTSLSDAQNQTGLAGEIERLLRTAPELGTTTEKPVAAPVLDSLSAALDSGVSTQAVVLFQLLSTRHDIDARIHETDLLRQQADDMRSPMVKLLRSTIRQGDAAMQSAPDPKATSADILADTRKHYDTLAATFRVLSTAMLPLSQEIVTLDSSRANLLNWRIAVDAEYSTVLRHLLLRVFLIALALGVLLTVSQVWQKLTVKYVHDLRRRRQLMVVRRLVTGFLSGIVLIFGFVTQFNSLATFAGFITAGIAVGLQTILLSVAAYFFIVGRYGVRVGDRITVAGVTGDVVDVGLVRFYMMELTGTGTELHPTGRVAVFANSILFQAGTPLYKQMPGTEYAWHELTVKLKPDTDYHASTDAILKAVTSVYDGYREQIEQQHSQVQDWMETALDTPKIEPRLQLIDTGLQYAVLFPVQIKNAATIDEQIVHLLLDDMASNDVVKNSIVSPPIVKAVIKG
ncbi:MAG: hypothetical protein ACRYF4_09715 [Janthinobacterium lividum]